jgi:hydroxypyruvate isomerase
MARRTLVDNLGARERLEGIARVLLEPINAHDVPGYIVDRFDAARTVISDCAGRVGLQFDVYHAACMGLDPLSELAENLSLVRHVQFADAPGRHEPGTGRIDFAPLWTLLDNAGYAGFVAAEYRPSGDTRSSFGWLDAWRAELVRTRDSR